MFSNVVYVSETEAMSQLVIGECDGRRTIGGSFVNSGNGTEER